MVASLATPTKTLHELSIYRRLDQNKLVSQLTSLTQHNNSGISDSVTVERFEVSEIADTARSKYASLGVKSCWWARGLTRLLYIGLHEIGHDRKIRHGKRTLHLPA